MKVRVFIGWDLELFLLVETLGSAPLIEWLNLEQVKTMQDLAIFFFGHNFAGPNFWVVENKGRKRFQSVSTLYSICVNYLE